ncbi:hypothetical protein EI427_21375 [Flammeovirga pectinis]|uniref:Uncharacterized protein n=1 Tax=Flammeovirga pectinis TaxID=2494373 RepID=A0A3S9P9B6_9BACT|nr:hypothetical protein [Flammeovirga pectinis]AZQ64779.1 hypothetical protein EI427_21375 [Flammeovirga pectinis]
MKNLIKLSAFVLLFFFTITSYASTIYYLPYNGISYFFKSSLNGKDVSLIFNDLDGEEINFRITNKKGDVFYEKKIIGTGRIVEDINLKSLPEGNFIFRMSFEDKIMQREFFVTPSKTSIMLNYSLTSNQDKFRISVKDEALFLLLEKNVKGFVKMRLKKENGEILYSNKFLAEAKKI